MTLGLLVACAGFIWANKSTGTWVRVWLRDDADDDPPVEANIFTLSTWSTVRDFWRSGAKSTAVVTGITAGALPYVVLGLIGLVWWLLPQTRTAASIFHLVRFEHVLTMAAILLCVALKTDIPLSQSVLKVRTVFGWGTFGFELANCLSYLLALSIRPRRRLVAFPRTSIATHAGFFAPALIASLFNVLVCILALALPSARFTVRELASDYVSARVRRFSVVDIVFALAGSTRRAEAKAFWTIWLAALCVVIPVASTIAVALVLVVPLHRRGPAVFFAVEHLHATASADVLFVVLANISQNIGRISSWIVNDQAKDVCDAVKHRTRYDGCALVTGYPLQGFGWLAAHAFLNNALHFALYARIDRLRLEESSAEEPLLEQEVTPQDYDL